MSENSFRAYLAENPRMIGVLFAMLVALTQAGNAAAGIGAGGVGP